MTRDNHANFGRIGFTVFVGVLAIAIALIYIAGIGDGSREFMVETYYDHPVSGLSVGSPVNFRGVRIGEVREINFVYAMYPDDEVTSNDFQRVVIVMALKCEDSDVSNVYTPERVLKEYLNAGIRATVASNPVTGMSRIELNIPANPLPPAQLAWKPRYCQIPPQPSLFEDMSSSLAKALSQFNKTDFKAVWSNLASVAESSAKVTRDVSELVSSEKEGLSVIVHNITEASESVDELAEQLKNNPSLLLRNRDPEVLPETR